MGNTSNNKKVFGVTLQEAVERSDKLKLVPSVLRHAFAYLNAKGLSEEGIYRIPGSRRVIREWREKYDRGIYLI
jgi:hypothetical protein